METGILEFEKEERKEVAKERNAVLRRRSRCTTVSFIYCIIPQGIIQKSVSLFHTLLGIYSRLQPIAVKRKKKRVSVERRPSMIGRRGRDPSCVDRGLRNWLLIIQLFQALHHLIITLRRYSIASTRRR